MLHICCRHSIFCKLVGEFVVDLLYNLFLQLTSFDWRSASRGPSAVAELLVSAMCLTAIMYAKFVRVSCISQSETATRRLHLCTCNIYRALQ